MLFNNKQKKKKEVIAYIHSHWDREWYREFEVFRLRLIRVFDNVLNMLQNDLIPSFYFDGQIVALLDYLEIRPEKEQLVRDLIKQRKLYIGPFYCLVDEYLTDGICFRKNLEIGLKIARAFGCEDFIGYFADTFGHSQNIFSILREYNIHHAVVWRGVGDLPSEFVYDGVNTINLIRGYFNDIFASSKSVEQKTEFLRKELDLIAEKSSDVLLLPIGADHLNVPCDIKEQIEKINQNLEDYEIRLGSLFEYIEKVKFTKSCNEELRNNGKTFILPGSYSARIRLKQLNTECSYLLDLANKVQYNFGNNYSNAIDYAYKLLLMNQAHDSICGCSTDDVHKECEIRYNKVLQIAKTIIDEVKFSQNKNFAVSFSFPEKYKILEKTTLKPEKDEQIITKEKGFSPILLSDTYKIPVTEDYTNIYTVLKEFNPSNKTSNLNVSGNILKNSDISIEVDNGEINLYSNGKKFSNFIEFVRYKDLGDTYNFSPDVNDRGDSAKILSARTIMDGPLRKAIRIETSFFYVDVFLNKHSKLLNFKINWVNTYKDKLLQIKFNLCNPVKDVYSEDLNMLISRKFNPDYDIRQNMPKQKGKEVFYNIAPMQRFAWSQGFGIITKGLQEYSVYKNTLSITLLRSIGIISNPKNPARTTPAGPPLEVPDAQQLGKNTAEFSIGFFDISEWVSMVEEIYPQTILF